MTLINEPIAVVDVETTGLFPFRQDRIIEIAVVVLGKGGVVVREFVTLINPGRDIGPSRIHGLTSTDVLHAPRFDEIASDLVDVLQSAVGFAAHNARFDRQFLESEFGRLGIGVPGLFTVCTMELVGGGKLEQCCADYGVQREGTAHHALSDARAAAGLLIRALEDHPEVAESLSRLRPAQWPKVDLPRKAPVTRADAVRRRQEPSSYVQRLLTRRGDHALSDAMEGSIIAYGALLDRALEDRQIDEQESDALIETAKRWGLSATQIEQAHVGYMHQLAIAAVADGSVSPAERADLKQVAQLLGHNPGTTDALIDEATARLSEVSIGVTSSHRSGSDLAGKRVCFTGELMGRIDGQVITRERAEHFAVSAGLLVMSAVTKQCDLLVVADPNTQSGKAVRARKYGIRILHEMAFWKAIGVKV